MKRVAALMIATVVALMGCTRSETPSPEPTASVAETAAPAETTATAVADVPAASTKEAVLGAKLAEYSANRLDGTPYVVSEQKGKVVLLNVWATWCQPCRHEIPELKKLQADLGPKGLEVVGISVDEGPASDAEVRAFVAEKAIGYPVVLDPEQKILLLLGSSTVPTTVLLDKQGNVAWYSVGVVQSTDPALQEAFTKVFAQ